MGPIRDDTFELLQVKSKWAFSLILAKSILCQSPVSTPTSCQIPSSLLLVLEIFWINPKNSWTGILSELSYSYSLPSSTQLDLKVAQKHKGNWSHGPPAATGLHLCPLISAPMHQSSRHHLFLFPKTVSRGCSR